MKFSLAVLVSIWLIVATFVVVYGLISGRRSGGRLGKLWILLAPALFYLVVLRPRDAQPSTQERELITGSLKKAQIFEFCTVYGRRSAQPPSTLNQYWLPSEKGGTAVTQVQATLRRLQFDGVYYGKGCKPLLFDTTFVRSINATLVEVYTAERWELPVFNASTDLPIDTNSMRPTQKEPFRIRYTLRKELGKWLIESAADPYIERTSTSPIVGRDEATAVALDRDSRNGVKLNPSTFGLEIRNK